ncbi:MAG: peptidylprolyl isomerase [Cyclobacteriaceae bacterium]|nr:peptidylprolyl isomerase [Cyclobacteriaceae bacterium]
MRVFWVLTIILLFPVSLQAQQKKSAKASPLFTAAGTPVSTDEFSYTYRKNHQNNPQDFTEEKVNEYLQLFINFKLKVAEAHSRGLDTTAKFNSEFKTYREELKKPYRAEEDALEKLVQQTYKRLTEEVRAAHILISVNADAPPADTLAAFQKAQDIRKRIVAGEDFEKLARELSQDPSAKLNGGDLGYFTALQMVGPFEEAAYATPVGGLSPVVRTRFGYHIIQVKDRKPARGEVEVSHILLRAGGDDGALRSKVFSAHDQLRGGRSWDEVCREFSDDKNTSEQGGRLRAFGVGALASVPEFEAMAFSMKQPGEISDPFQSSLGWHIIRLERQIPLPPQKEMEASLRRRLGRDERVQQSQQAQKSARRKAYQFAEQKETLEKVLAKADSTLTKADWTYIPEASLGSQQLFSVVNTPYTVKQFVAFAKKNQKVTRLAPRAYAQQLYDEWAEEKIEAAEEESLKRENPDFRNLLTEYREGILLFEIMESEVWNKASEDTVGQKKYYEANRNKYQAGDRVEARYFAATDKKIITEIVSKINHGDSLTGADLRRFKSVQHFRVYEKKDSKVIDRVSWVTGLHEAEADGQHYLVEIKRLVPPGIKSFSEARAQVIADYQDELEKQWVASLRQKYPVKVNKKGRKHVVAALTKK